MVHRIICCLFALQIACAGAFAQEFDDLNEQAYQERKNKNYEKAIDLCGKALEKKINTRSYIIRGGAKYDLGRYESAIDDFNNALYYYADYYGSDLDEKAGIYYYRARCKQNLNHYSDAITDFISCIGLNYKESGYAYWNRGSCYYELKQYKEADDDYINAISRISASDDLCTLWENRGDCQANLANYTEAWSCYAKAISYNPGNYSPYWQRGHFKAVQGEYTVALKDFEKAIELINAGGTTATSKDLALLYRNMALMHINLKQKEKALEDYNKSIEYDPNFAKAYRNRGAVYQGLKQYDKARADYENAVTLQPDQKIKSDIYLDRSIMYWNILDYKNCMADITKAIEADPEDGMNFWHRSMLNGYKKNYPAAINDCNTALALYQTDSSSKASLTWLRAGHKTMAGDFNGAIDDYREYAKYYPESYSVYYEIGKLYKLKLKNNDLANANLSRAARLAWDAKDSSKYCYIKVVSGEKDEPFRLMLVHAENVKEDEYQYKWELHNIACMYSLAGNAIKGLEYLEKSMKAGFDDFLHLVNDRDLELLMKQPQWKLILAKYKVPAIKN